MKREALFHSKRQMRLLALDKLLRTPVGLTRKQICDRLASAGHRTSQRNFFRDIECLRKDFGAPLGGDPLSTKQKRQQAGSQDTLWKYDNLSWTFGKVETTEGDLFALFVARQVVEQYAGLPVGEELNRIYSGLTETMNSKVTVARHDLLPITFVPEKRRPIDSKIWTPLLDATMKHKRLSITYLNRWNEEGRGERVVCPYHIANLHGEWYLLGSRSANDMSLRQYVISRIHAAKSTGKSFNMPKDINIKMLLEHTFGTFIGDHKKLVNIRLLFSKTVAPLVHAREFHPWQTMTTRPDGRLEVRFDASTSGPWPLYHVKSWVLSWGSDVEVLEPEELKKMVAAEAQRVVEMYPLPSAPSP